MKKTMNDAMTAATDQTNGTNGRVPGVFVILGGTGGIGSALSRRLAGRGARLVIAARGEDRLTELCTSIDAHPRRLDATDLDQVEACVSEAVEMHGRLTGIVNCVGSIMLKPAHLTSTEEFRDTLHLNLVTAFNAVRAASRVMMRSGGSIVLLSSAAARLGLANHEAVAAAKAGVEGLVLASAASYASAGIRVNAVAPGLVDTPLASRITGSDAGRRASLAMHPLGRLGEPDDIAAAIAWLLDPRNDWITGQIIGVDGGLGSLKTIPAARSRAAQVEQVPATRDRSSQTG
jgi:3-oxoacyl-[acyl-carrier protein] reductase